MTPEEILELSESYKKEQDEYEHEIRICVASGCISNKSDELKSRIEELVKERGLESKCKVKGVGCLCYGLCSAGPLVHTKTDDQVYEYVKPEDAERIVDSLSKGPIKEMACDQSMPFFTKQTKIVLENSGIIDPESIEDYIAHDGYTALSDTLQEWEPNQIIDEITNSGLRGRGGGGYPTGLKWGTVAKAVGNDKYVVCNADEGDPGAFMDRTLLESDPHRVLEGMVIAGYAIGASRGYIYVRAEYQIAIDRVNKAVRQAKKMGLLGNNILGSSFNFEIQVRLGAGAFVCGEETALIESIEGGRGNPRPRPPYPAELGVWGEPTLINNVETFANIKPIIRNGADWFKSFGTENSRGTKVFALAGQVVNTGLIEVPMGMSLREIVEDIGGGTPKGMKIKAVQTGGPSGGCIPESKLDVPVDYESLKDLGSMMGSGGMIVIDDGSSMVEMAHFFMEFCVSESCGKCVPCRAGTPQLLALLERVRDGEATAEDIELLEEISDVVQQTSLCGLGQTAPNPVLSTLHFFRHEYESLLVASSKGNGKAPAAAKAE